MAIGIFSFLKIDKLSYYTKMNIDEILIKNKLLEEELNQTKDELYKTKEHLKKYTAPPSSKVYI